MNSRVKNTATIPQKVTLVCILGLLLFLPPAPCGAREYDVAYTDAKTLKAMCKDHGEFQESDTSYHCTYKKQGNIRECSKQTKRCLMVTPK